MYVGHINVWPPVYNYIHELHESKLTFVLYFLSKLVFLVPDVNSDKG